MFYDNELIALADSVMTTSLCNWDALPTKGIPLFFHGIEVIALFSYGLLTNKFVG